MKIRVKGLTGTIIDSGRSMIYVDAIDDDLNIVQKLEIKINNGKLHIEVL